MKIELILLGIIGVVFLIDFLLKGRKKNTENSEITVHVKEKKQSYKTTWKAWVFLILGGLIFGVFFDFIVNLFYGADFRDYYFNFSYGSNFYLFLINLIIGFLIFTLAFYLKRKIWFLNILNYILNRKKNITLSIIIIVFLKVNINYRYYRLKEVIELKNTITSSGKKAYRTKFYNFTEHMESAFSEEIWLFIPSVLIIIFISWFFNDKIKAR